MSFSKSNIVITANVNIHTEESMVDKNSVNAQPISECAVKKLKGMCAVSFFAGIDAYINCFG